MKNTYIIITAARNEKTYIDNTIRSVCNQYIKPKEWVIVSDNSTDDTEKIVQSYQKSYSFIRLFRLENDYSRNFASKTFALNYGYNKLKDIEYEFIAILDADIMLPQNYYKSIIEKFYNNPLLGISGGIVYDKKKSGYKRRIGNTERSVPGGIQVFRRKCYENIGGFLPLKYGGEDWIAEIKGKLNGWEVRSYHDIKVLHNRPTGTATGNSLIICKNAGTTAYFIGSHPIFEILKALKRINEWPYLFCAMSRIYGYFKEFYKNNRLLNSSNYSIFLRKEQKDRIRNIYNSIINID
jgi:glycosyltransferase involved in cell wall biosynthesis